MRASNGRFVVVLLVVALGICSGTALAAELSVSKTEAGTSLALSGARPFHTTQATVGGARLVEIAGSRTRVATWTETGADGAVTPYYALGLGGAPMGEGRPTSYLLKLKSGEFDPLADGVPAVEPALRAGEASRLNLVQFVTQPLQEYRDALSALGAQVRHFMHHHALVVEMSPAVREKVRALDFVRWVGPYHPAYRVEQALRADAATLAARYPSQRYSILVFDAHLASKERLARRIRAFGGTVHQRDAGKFLMTATLTPAQFLALMQWDEIAYVDRWSPLEKDMDLVRIQGGANDLETVAGYRGQGVRAEVFDAGFNLSHPDFASRPPLTHGGAVGLDSHGTATFGINFGDGTGDPKARGLVPLAQGIAADYNNVGLDGGPGRYNHTGELKEAPYFAVFQTSSVGSARTTEYTTISADHDTLLFDWDVLHCQSQSNAGNRDSRPQAWAKNVVSGGAFNHYDTIDKSDDCWCSTASIGPATDGRIKPDLSFYYDSTWTTYTTGTGYGDFGGTSGATPSICGYFGLFFQMWSDGIFGNDVIPGGTVFENRPHMTTAKAMMINTAIQYPFSGQAHDMTRVHQGWGVPNVKNLYDLRGKISFIDESVILQNTQTAEFNVLVDPGEPALRFTMTYADPAGNPAASIDRINDLTLKVTSPSGVVYWGNNGLLDGNWSIPGGSPNTVDTVENVFVQNPQSGIWVVAVSATEIVQDGHVETPALDADFALVVSGGEISTCTPDGAVSFNSNEYACESQARVRVVDCDLNTSDTTIETVSVTVTSDTEPTGETIVLTETDPASGTFQAFLPLSTTNAPGVLAVRNTDTIVATYLDANNGGGGTNVTKTATATIDCAGPLITSVRDENVGLTSASVLWHTDELADTVMRYGTQRPPTTPKVGLGRSLDHRLDLSGLTSCTIYYYEVESTDVNGNRTIDSNGGQYYFFETLGDFGAGPVSCHRGDLQITESQFSCSDVVSMRLSDLDLNTNPATVQAVVVDVASTTEATPERVTLTETGPNTSLFQGSIATAAGNAVQDGVLQLAHGDVITATYHDMNDGIGGRALSYDTATADCVGPAVRSLRVETITDQRAIVRWNTDVPATTKLEWGRTAALGQLTNDTALTTDHAVTVNRSTTCGTLHFRVSGTDGFGDVTVADENGVPFRLSTGTIPGLYYRMDFESGAPGWSLGGHWEVGAPQGRGGSSGLPDPSVAYNNDGVLGHDLTGRGAFPGDYEPGTTESARTPTLDGRTWANTKLIFYRSLHSGANDEAMVRVWVGPGYPVFRTDKALVNDTRYSYQGIDIAGIADGKPSVQIEFLQQADATGNYSGWTVDDVILKDGSKPDYDACKNCAGVPSFGGAIGATDNNACAASGVTVSWNPAVSWGTASGGSYAVYRGESASFVPGPSNLVADGVTTTSYNDLAAPTNRDLWYVVRAESNETCSSGPNNGGTIDTNTVRRRVGETTSRSVPAAITTLDVARMAGAHVRLTWPATAGADRYRVYRSSRPDLADRALLGETTNLFHDDLGSAANKTAYFYEVVAVNACGVQGP